LGNVQAIERGINDPAEQSKTLAQRRIASDGGQGED
jgi:hypothetical protein